jgi:hypothetical protein
VALQIVAAHGPDRHDERQARPLLPQLAEVVHLQAGLRQAPQIRAQPQVADDDGGVRLAHHPLQVGLARVVVGPHSEALAEQQPREPYGRTGSGTQRDLRPVELVERDAGDDLARHHRAVAADGDIRKGDESVRIPEEFDESDRADIEIAVHQLVAELFRGVPCEVQIEQ